MSLCICNVFKNNFLMMLECMTLTGGKSGVFVSDFVWEPYWLVTCFFMASGKRFFKKVMKVLKMTSLLVYPTHQPSMKRGKNEIMGYNKHWLSTRKVGNEVGISIESCQAIFFIVWVWNVWRMKDIYKERWYRLLEKYCNRWRNMGLRILRRY